mmetsp:Transcript_59261/g.138043  ORF Transcript_59261/g.138043 Transcript_59261/m.138043 type:complete len:222 (-) Transcript_59261:49-714(-)
MHLTPKLRRPCNFFTHTRKELVLAAEAAVHIVVEWQGRRHDPLFCLPCAMVAVLLIAITTQARQATPSTFQLQLRIADHTLMQESLTAPPALQVLLLICHRKLGSTLPEVGGTLQDAQLIEEVAVATSPEVVHLEHVNKPCVGPTPEVSQSLRHARSKLLHGLAQPPLHQGLALQAQVSQRAQLLRPQRRQLPYSFRGYSIQKRAVLQLECGECPGSARKV